MVVIISGASRRVYKQQKQWIKQAFFLTHLQLLINLKGNNSL